MRILYHPKRVLGFETYCAPEGFDRKAQPVDIYDVFERYYKNHRTAKWIYSVLDSNIYCELRGGTSYRYSYISGGIRYYHDYNDDGYTTLSVTLTAGNTYDTITVSDTTGYPDSGVICLVGNYYQNREYFEYTSKDSTHFYGASKTFTYNHTGGQIFYSIKWVSGSTKRWVIAKHTTMTSITCSGVSGMSGPEWLYCGNLINSIGTSGSSGEGGVSTLKWIHIHRLDNITTYSYCAHYGHANLTGNLYISKSATQIGTYAPGGYEYGIVFDGCSGITGTVTIPANIKRINNQSFRNCRNITGLVLNEGLEYIGRLAFHTCDKIDGSIGIPDTCIYIGNQAFINCNKLDILDLGTGVQTIGNSAFQACAQLSGTLTMPDSLTTIGTLAFYGCTSFSGALTIPANVTSIGQGAFGDDNFTDIDVTANSRYEDVDDVLYEISTRTALHSVKSDTGTITFQTNTLIIGDYCCLRNQRTGTLTVPDSVTRVGISAFYDCDGFTALDLETTTSALATIDDYAFAYLSNLAGTITIPDSVTLIDANAFRDCLKVTGLSFGTGLITIGAAAFYNLPLVTSLTLPSNLVTIGQSAFENLIALTGNIVIPNSVETIAAYAFRNDYKVTGLTFGSGVTSLATTAFNLCSGVTNIGLGINGTTVTALIAQKAYFINLATLTIDASNPTYSMVSGCNILFNKVQTSVSWIPPKATGDLYIPDGVTTIDSLSAINTFSGFFYLGSGLTSITNLYLLSKVFSTLDVSSSNPNYADNADNILYNKTLTQIYYVCKPGSGTLTIPGTITAIASEAFANCIGYTALSLPLGYDLSIYSNFKFSTFSDSSVDTSILNCADGDPGDPFEFLINQDTLDALLLYNPDAVTDAALRYIDILLNQPIVLDGLVCWLDAGDSASYPGSGATWYDLTVNGNNGTITGTVPWSVDKFQFPGTSGNYINIPSPNLKTSNHTIQILARYAGANPRARILSGLANNWVAGWHQNVLYRYYAEGWIWNNSTPAGDENWHFITAQGNITTDKYSEYNGITAIVTDNSSGSQGPNGISLPRYGPSNTEYSQCEVSVLLIYNRVLTPAEIEDNFEAYRGRYGI